MLCKLSGQKLIELSIEDTISNELRVSQRTVSKVDEQLLMSIHSFYKHRTDTTRLVKHLSFLADLSSHFGAHTTDQVQVCCTRSDAYDKAEAASYS
jgi:hypothetical protein